MNSKIRVMQLVWRFSTGGAERMVINFHEHFRNHEQIEIKTLSFTPVTNGIFEEYMKNDPAVAYIPEFWTDRIRGIVGKILRRLFRGRLRKKWLLKQIADFSPDIIHIHLSDLAVGVYEVCKRLPSHMKVIYHLHSMPEAIDDKKRSVLRKAIEENLYYPVCVTELQKKSAIRFYNVDLNAPIVYNGIDQSKFLNTALSQQEQDELKQDLGIPLDATVIGSVGRGAPIKNYPLIAAAAGELSKKNRIALLIVGEISDELQKQIVEKAENATVVFTGQRKDTNRLYRIMDVFALASFFESSSIVTVEAQLSGTPCVISDRISDEVVISSGVTKCSPEASPAEWARKIKSAIDREVELTQPSRFAFETTAMQMFTVYENLQKRSDR